MSLESASWATQLSSSDPQSSDPRSQGDDHLRLIKTVLKAETAANNKGWVYTGDTVTRVSGSIFTTTGDQTAVYPEGRRVKVVGSSTGTIYGRVSSSTYSTNTAVNLHFDGTGSSMSNETLAPYVGAQWQAPGSTTGTFTPALAFGGGTTGITYVTQQGKYIRSGNFVWIDITISLTSKGSSNGTVTITGFPLAGLETGLLFVSAIGAITLAIGRPYATFVGSTLGLADGNANLTDAEFANNSTFRICGMLPAN